jgi:hypothetical protein
MTKALPALFLLLSSIFAVAQTPAYTTSVSFGCNGIVCNGVPLDQGGVWQFIELNQAFSVDNIVNGVSVLYIYGNPGNLSTYNPVTGAPGGMQNISDQIPPPPNLYLNGSTGAEGTLTFNWGAISSNGTTYYTGHAVVQGHRVRHYARSPRGSGSFYTQIVVDGAQIYIDSVN